MKTQKIELSEDVYKWSGLKPYLTPFNMGGVEFEINTTPNDGMCEITANDKYVFEVDSISLLELANLNYDLQDVRDHIFEMFTSHYEIKDKEGKRHNFHETFPTL